MKIIDSTKLTILVVFLMCGSPSLAENQEEMDTLKVEKLPVVTVVDNHNGLRNLRTKRKFTNKETRLSLERRKQTKSKTEDLL